MAMCGTAPVWAMDVELPHFPTLDAPGELDVVIVGGGITGLTAALLLQRNGYRTIVLDQQQLGCGETSRSSAHLTVFPDPGFARLIGDFGVDAARAVLRSQIEALAQIELLAQEIACDFARVPGHLFAETSDEAGRLDEELDAARALDAAVERLDRAPLPFATAGVVVFPNQAQLHPLKYLAGLVRLYAEAGGMISERAHVRTIEEAGDHCRVQTDRSLLYSRHVVSATDAPITGDTLLDTKLRANRTYVMAGRIASAARIEGLHWDTADPYHYIRTADTRSGPVILVGGEDHRVGTDGEREALARIEQHAAERFGGFQVLSAWSGQIMESVDGLPFIGPREENSRVLLATGYAGNGLTFGTTAAQMVVDAIAGRVHDCAALYAPNRALGAKQWAKYAAQNLPAAWTLVTDILPLTSGASIEGLKPGDGAIVRVEGQKVAAARDAAGVIHLVSPTCTHMGCDVAWNVVERTWDCPCHGSRYGVDGTVLHGPATAPLENLTAVASGTGRAPR